MLPLNLGLTLTTKRIFVSARGISTLLSLLFALFYTNYLGVDKRSLLVFIMVGTLLIGLILGSGVSLGVRSRGTRVVDQNETYKFLVFVLIISFLVSLLNLALLYFFSRIIIDVEPKIFAVVAIYSFLAILNSGFQDALLAEGKVSIATFLDVSTILIQIGVFSFFYFVNEMSAIVNVLVSFITSYLMISFATSAILFNSLKFPGVKVLFNLYTLVEVSQHKHLYGIALGIVDRLDRLLVGIFLPIQYLAKYSLLTSILTFSRFLPDGIGKLLLLEGRGKKPADYLRISGSQRILGFIAILATSVCSYFAIEIWFGPAWVLPFGISIMISTQEFLRGVFHSRLMHMISVGYSRDVLLVSKILIALTLMLTLPGIYFLGLWGLCAATLLMYSIVNIVTVLILRGD